MLQPGDKVKFLDEVGEGIILGIYSGGQVKILTTEGFELLMSLTKLIPIGKSAEDSRPGVSADAGPF